MESMFKVLALFAIVFFGFTLQFLCGMLMDLSIATADKTIGKVPAMIKGFFSLLWVIVKAVFRVCFRFLRDRKIGSVTREARTEVGPSGIHVRVNPIRTDNALGHSATQMLNSGRKPVIIEHQPIVRR